MRFLCNSSCCSASFSRIESTGGLFSVRCQELLSCCFLFQFEQLHSGGVRRLFPGESLRMACQRSTGNSNAGCAGLPQAFRSVSGNPLQSQPPEILDIFKSPALERPGGTFIAANRCTAEVERNGKVLPDRCHSEQIKRDAQFEKPAVFGQSGCTTPAGFETGAFGYCLVDYILLHSLVVSRPAGSTHPFLGEKRLPHCHNFQNSPKL